jgi:hypothetical protein
MREIERQASEAWRATPCEVPGVQAMAEEEYKVVAAYDFLTVQIPRQDNDQGGSEVVNTQPMHSNPRKRKRKARSDGTR